MTIAFHMRKIARQTAGWTVGPAIWLGLIAYFAFFAIYGDRGLYKMHRLEGEVERARATLEGVRDDRQRLERRTTLLRPDSLDLDMVDERARQMLNMSHPNDVVIMLSARPEPAAARRNVSGP